MQTAAGFDAESFERGVRVALSSQGQAGLLSTIFSSRTLGLTGQLAASAQPDYLSGLLIGHELSGLCASLRQQQAPLPAVVLVGSDSLCQRYQQALALAGFPTVTLAEQATERGLWQVAQQAGLLSSAGSVLLKEV